MQSIQLVDIILLTVACPEVYDGHIVIVENRRGDGVTIQRIGDEIQIFAVFLDGSLHGGFIRNGNFDALPELGQAAFQFAEGCLCILGEMVDTIGIIRQEKEAEIARLAQRFRTVEKGKLLLCLRGFEVLRADDEKLHQRGH